MAKRTMDENAAKSVKATLEQLIKEHGVDVVQRVFNRQLGAMRELRKLAAARRELDKKMDEQRRELERDYAKAEKKLK